MLDSFVIYICTEGEFRIRWDGKQKCPKGETILIPAVITNVILEPAPAQRLSRSNLTIQRMIKTS
jgi:mannose-6-phosphate isomerase class I